MINEMNDYFKVPIFYNDKKVKIKQPISEDLELVKTIDASGCKPMYNYFFNNENELSTKLTEQMSEYYTTDVSFITDNQTLLKEYKKIDITSTNSEPKYTNMLEIWNEIKRETDFKDKYYYISWPILEFLNTSEFFLQFMSLYNLASPIISLLIPIILLIIPFFVIQIKGITLTVSEYVDVLKMLAQSHAIGKLFTQFNKVSLNEKMYLLFSACFYIFSIYQNITVCVKFHNNMIKIHRHFNEISSYLYHTVNSMENYLTYSKNLSSQKEFNSILREKVEILKQVQHKISDISEYKITSVQKIQEIGRILKYFYELHDDVIYNDAIMYSFGFNGYIDCLEGLQNNIDERKINFALFIKKGKKSIFKNAYYAPLKDETPIKNTIQFAKNMIITGPNASGKTTTLKTALINILLTQQFGCGFYESAKLCPFKYVHCYLNIPDTSGRDSLFQAEARRCKDILDMVKTNPDERHFCVFDELYSGTNPDEAVASAVAFMNYLIKNKNVYCLLTTHFIKICKKLRKNKNILNCNMVTSNVDDKLIYTYKLAEGISEVKGGIKVLTEMDYPKEILYNSIQTRKQ
jgi:DNA mismatch repair protein MutS